MKSCNNCSHALIIGRDIPATMIDPAEYAEAECHYDGHGDIEKFHELMELLSSNYIVYKTGQNLSVDYLFTAKYCPFYE